MSIRDNSGYNNEDKYIHEHEVEKIKEIRAKREAQKKAAEKELHWMKCPKCGSDMEEIELESIMVDKCTNCNGLYFDAGEMELLIEGKQSPSFFDKVSNIWK